MAATDASVKPKDPRKPKDWADLVVRELDRDPRHSPKEVRHLLGAACTILAAYLEDGHVVRLPGAFIVRASFYKPRKFRSNLPRLRGRVFQSSVRARLKVQPEGRLNRYLKRGLIGR